MIEPKFTKLKTRIILEDLPVSWTSNGILSRNLKIIDETNNRNVLDKIGPNAYGSETVYSMRLDGLKDIDFSDCIFCDDKNTNKLSLSKIMEYCKKKFNTEEIGIALYYPSYSEKIYNFSRFPKSSADYTAVPAYELEIDNWLVNKQLVRFYVVVGFKSLDMFLTDFEKQILKDIQHSRDGKTLFDSMVVPAILARIKEITANENDLSYSKANATITVSRYSNLMTSLYTKFVDNLFGDLLKTYGIKSRHMIMHNGDLDIDLDVEDFIKKIEGVQNENN